MKSLLSLFAIMLIVSACANGNRRDRATDTGTGTGSGVDYGSDRQEMESDGTFIESDESLNQPGAATDNQTGLGSGSTYGDDAQLEEDDRGSDNLGTGLGEDAELEEDTGLYESDSDLGTDSGSGFGEEESSDIVE